MLRPLTVNSWQEQWRLERDHSGAGRIVRRRFSDLLFQFVLLGSKQRLRGGTEVKE